MEEPQLARYVGKTVWADGKGNSGRCLVGKVRTILIANFRQLHCTAF